jgi:hypothetical protein
MNRIELTGLRADLPIGAMAALGCLRVCERIPLLRGSRLSWEPGGGSFHAVLWTREETSRDELIAALLADVRTAADREELKWSEQIKTASRETFVAEARKALERATAEDHESADWFAAFGSELVTDDGKVEATPFDMSVARQKFVADARKLAAGLAQKGGAESYSEALFGPWRYQDDQHSLGWDPSTMKLGAFTYKAPTAMANAGVRAAVWLAFESLPVFPCFYDGSLETRGFRRQGRTVIFCWPVWNSSLSLDAIGTLLGWGALLEKKPPAEELQARGVVAVFRSAKFKPNKYLANFRTAELAFAAQAR